MAVVELPPADEVLEFLEYVKSGSGVETAAYALNWTPRKLKALMSDREFQAGFRQAITMQVESAEEAVYKLAMRGNGRMLEFYLVNRAPDRWAPATQKIKIEKNVTHSVELVGSAVEAVRQAITSKGAIAAIHAGALEVEARDDDH